MIKLGKTSASNKELDETLVSSHNLDIRIGLSTSDGSFEKNLTEHFQDGAVSVDSDAQITRALDLVLFDPGGNVNIEPTSASKTSIFIADNIDVTYVVSTPDRQKVWEIPVFTGPIDTVQREDFKLTIKCLGKESMYLSNVWRGKTFKKNQQKTDVIKEILRDWCGQNKMDIPDLKAKLPNDLKFNSEDSPWIQAKKLARSMGYQLFFDGRGIPVMRRRTKTPRVRFTSRWVTTYPVVSYDLGVTVNAVRVVGGKPKKNKPKIRYTAVAKRKHPLSPWRLGRNGAPRFLWLEIVDDSIKSKKDAKRIAQSELKHGLLAGVNVTFDGIPHPRLQEMDICRVDVDAFNAKFAARRFTIPLMAGDDSSYGYLRRARPKGGQRGVKVKKKHRHKGDNKGGKQ